MASAPKQHHHHNPSSSKPPRNPGTTNDNADTRSPSPNLPLSPQDLTFTNASHLTRQELLRRRSHHLKQLSRCYRDHYWALMEELKVQYREYYWKYGVSPCKEFEERESGERGGINAVGVEGSGENNNVNNKHDRFGLGLGESSSSSGHQCSFVGCKLKAMALTNFCHLHILSDSKQNLYKPCNYVIKSAQAGPIFCGKPILRSTVPSLCTAHFQKAQKHVTRALKQGGLNVSSSSKLAPKFHVIVAEYVRQIQAKRRAAQSSTGDKILVKKEIAS
ncbi:hypothetical protein L1049_016082 [Liquidambar formosana]|uniref:KAT8 regulatory NSL complex subunit 2 n=1 Tax=Liquidambar formosana TaxID=63359 RepID=A0AAP0S5U7_LIQFO